MTEPTAYDMSQYMRLISVDGGRVTGMFKVSPPDTDRPERETWVKAVDVTIWSSDAHNTGRVFYSGDLTCSVKAGEVKLGYVPDNKRADVDSARPELDAAVLAAVSVFPFSSAHKPDSTRATV